MKTAILSLGLLFSIGIIVLQARQFAAQSGRQAGDIASIKSQYDEAMQENRSLKIALQKKADANAALTTGRAIATRYRNDPRFSKGTAAR